MTIGPIAGLATKAAALFGAAFFIGIASAQSPRPPEVQPGESKAADGSPLAPLAWLEGCWRGSVNKREFLEHWMPLRGNMMVGISQTVIEGRTADYEYLRLEPRPDGVYYVIAPSGKNEAAYRLTEQTVDHAADRNDEIFVFVDPEREFPRKITYRRASEGWLYAAVEGKVNGLDRLVTYPMRRTGCESGELIRR